MDIQHIAAALPIQDVNRALKFYEEVLGLNVEMLDDELGMYWATFGEQFRVLLFKRDQPTKAEHTVLTFSVGDIEKELSNLETKGVEFYADSGNKIFTLGTSRSAWFKDSEGNSLEISQRA